MLCRSGERILQSIGVCQFGETRNMESSGSLEKGKRDLGKRKEIKDALGG